MTPIRILVVEDEMLIAKDIEGMLRGLGYEIAALAATGEAAVDAALAGQPDLVLMDVILKGQMDGIEAAGLIKARADVPVVFLTAHTDEATLERIKVSEPAGCLFKPVEQRELRAAVDMALYKHGLLRALKESEEKFRNVFENAPVGIYRTTPDGRILMANPALVRILGYESAASLEARNLECEGFEAGYPRSVFIGAIESAGEVVGWESVWTKRDGTQAYIRENARAFRDRTGRTLFYEGTVEDVTAQREIERRYRDLYDHAPVGYHSLDADGTVMDMNDTELGWLGYRRGEVVGRMAYFDLQTPESAVRGRAIFEKLKAGGDLDELELTLRRKDGTTFPVLLTATVMRAGDGRLVFTRSTVMDIARRKSAEAALEESEAKYRALVDSSSEHIFMLDAGGRYLASNDRVGHLGLREGRSLVGRHLRDLFPAASVEAYTRALEQVRATGTGRDVRASPAARGPDSPPSRHALSDPDGREDRRFRRHLPRHERPARAPGGGFEIPDGRRPSLTSPATPDRGGLREKSVLAAHPGDPPVPSRGNVPADVPDGRGLGPDALRREDRRLRPVRREAPQDRARRRRDGDDDRQDGGDRPREDLDPQGFPARPGRGGRRRSAHPLERIRVRDDAAAQADPGGRGERPPHPARPRHRPHADGRLDPLRRPGLLAQGGPQLRRDP